MWSVVAGVNSKGVPVREAMDNKSPLKTDPLAIGSVVEQIELHGNALRYQLVEGSGPKDGWVSLIANGKVWLEKEHEVMLIPRPTTSPLPIALLFADIVSEGQENLYSQPAVQRLPCVSALMQEADKILGYDVRHGMRRCTRALMSGLVGWAILWHLHPIPIMRFQVVGGLGAGTYASLVVAGVLSLADGLKLAEAREDALAGLENIEGQAHLTVVGLTRDKVESLCNTARRKAQGSICQMTVVFSPYVYLCAGAVSSISVLKGLCTTAGATSAEMSRPAPAWGTELARPARDHIGRVLSDIVPRMRPPRCNVYMCSSGAGVISGCSVEKIAKLILKEVTTCHDWEGLVQSMVKEGTHQFYDLGPTQHLKLIMQRISPVSWRATTNIEEFIASFGCEQPYEPHEPVHF